MNTLSKETNDTSEEDSAPSDQLRMALAPVIRIPGDPEQDQPDNSVGLCLSGGGYRAMLFHVGALWRLNEVGLLRNLKRVSSVSGGSITAGMLGLAWHNLKFDDHDVALNFPEAVAEPLRRLANHTIDLWAVVFGILGRGTSGDHVAAAYGKYLFGTQGLKALPDETKEKAPRFVINATNMQSGVLWRFSRPYLADYLVGCINEPEIELARAVAASSSFPPFLSPSVFTFTDTDYSDCPHNAQPPRLHEAPYTTRVALTDGGVYDNLGLETVWKNHRIVLVSDGGGKMKPDPRPGHNWLSQFLRIRDITDNQVRSLRKRTLQASFQLKPGTEGQRYGAYWSMRIDIKRFELPDTLPCPYKETRKLASETTRLARLDERKQKQLINWGYAVTDAALRRAILENHLKMDSPPEAPTQFPYPDVAWSAEQPPTGVADTR